MVKRVPYFKKLSCDTIFEIVCLMKSEKFSRYSKIVRRGDNIRKLFFLFEGVITVQVPFLDQDLHFDYLNPGSNFCVYQCFDDTVQCIVNFIAQTGCLVHYIEVDDLLNLAKKH